MADSILPTPCANCLSSDTTSTKSILKGSPNTTLRSALSNIYGISFPFPESADDENLILCRNCNEFLFQLHHTFNHFKDLARPTSWIGAAHQDLENAKSIKTEVLEGDTSIPFTSAYMVQDAGCQYEDQEMSEDDLGVFDGSPLRTLASQYKVAFDHVTPTVAVISPAQLRADDVYGSDLEGDNEPNLLNGGLLENWAPPQVIFETIDSESKTKDTQTRSYIRGPYKRGGGRPRGSKNNVDSTHTRVIDADDWITRRSGRIKTPGLKIESTYSLSTDTAAPLSTDDLPKRGPGRPRKIREEKPPKRKYNVKSNPDKPKLESISTITDNKAITIVDKFKIKTQSSSSSPRVSTSDTPTESTRGGFAKRGRGRPFKSHFQNSDRVSSSRRNSSDYDPDWKASPSVKVSVVPLSQKQATNDTTLNVKSQPKLTSNGHVKVTAILNHPKSESGKLSSTPKKEYQQIDLKPKVKVGPGRPGPGGNLSTPVRKQYKYKCTDCGEKFEAIADIVQHKKTIHGRKPAEVRKPVEPVRCTTCNKPFFTKVAMLTHYEVMHGGGGAPDGLKKFTCRKPGCEKTFLYAASLTAHEATHLNPARSTLPTPTATIANPTEHCHVCDKKFFTKDFLELHMRTHFEQPAATVSKDDDLPPVLIPETDLIVGN